jgi:hypothetical protein
MALRSWNVFGELSDLICDGFGCNSASTLTAAPASIAESDTGTDSARRRMRAVTGSSAEECFCRVRCGVASMLCAALRALIF